MRREAAKPCGLDVGAQLSWWRVVLSRREHPKHLRERPHIRRTCVRLRRVLDHLWSDEVRWPELLSRLRRGALAWPRDESEVPNNPLVDQPE